MRAIIALGELREAHKMGMGALGIAMAFVKIASRHRTTMIVIIQVETHQLKGMIYLLLDRFCDVSRADTASS